MADIRALSELIRQAAFLQEGGGQPSNDEKLLSAFGTLRLTGLDLSTIRSQAVETALKKKQIELSSREDARKTAEEGRKSEEFRQMSGNSVPLAPGVEGPSEPPPSVTKRKAEADIAETNAKADYYKNGQVGGAKLYLNTTTREISETPKPGFIEVSANTAAGIAAGPAKEQAIDTRQDDARKDLQEERINRTVLQYANQLDNNYLLKEITKQGIGIDVANQLDELAAQGNTVAGAALGMKQARGMGEVGVITENDVTRYITSGKLTQKAADTLTRWMTGAPTPATLDEIVQINAVIKEEMGKKIQPIYDRAVNRLSRNLNISKEEAAERLDVPYSGGKPVEPPPPPPLSAEDQQALDWANANPTDARSGEIKRRLGR